MNLRRFRSLSLLFVCRQVCICGSSDHVVEEGEVLGDVLGGPVAEEGVQ